MIRTFSALLVLLSAICVAAPVSAAAPLKVVRSDDDLLLISLQLDSVSLSDELEAYMDMKGVFLPLGEVSRLLGLGITVNPDDGTASGFLINESREFVLDIPNQSIRVGGKRLQYDSARLEVHRNDIYVESKLLGDWLNVRLDVDQSAACVQAIPREPLPIQLRMDRERRAQQLSSNAPVLNSGYLRLRSPYRIWSEPFVDQSLSIHGGSGGAVDLQYSTVATASILGFDGAFYLNGGNGSTPTASSAVLKRFDPDGALLGPLHAREVHLGDIYSPTLPLISPSKSGRGVMISQYPGSEQRQFDTRSFMGRIQPGWDVELFRGNALIGYQTAGESGQYEFLDVALLFGLNDFRLLFHGPNGEQREENQRLFIGESMIRPGQKYGLVSINRQENGGSRLIVQQDIGLRRNLSASLAAASLQLADGIHQYQSVGFQGFWSGIAARSSLAFAESGGWGAETRIQTVLNSASVTLSHAQFNNFTSEAITADTNSLQSRSELRFDGLVLPPFLHLLPASLSLSHDRLVSGYESTLLSGRLSSYAKSVWLSNSFNVQRSSQQQLTADGIFLGSRRFGKTSLRCEIDYSLQPYTRLTGELFTIGMPFAGASFMNLEMRHQTGEKISFSGNISRNVGSYSLGVSLGSGQNGALSIGTTLTLGLGREPRTGELEISSQPIAQQGMVSARVFMDSNRNGKLDNLEKPLAGVGFQIDGTLNKTVTNAHGIAFIPRLPAYRLIDVNVATSTLDDALWCPSIEGVRMMPRPGNATLIDFPVIATGEISGTIRSRQIDGLHEASGVHLDLIDTTGKIVKSTRSAYDGFYTLSGVPAGKYTLLVSSEQAARLKLSAQPREVLIPPDGAFVDGIDLVLEPTTP